MMRLSIRLICLLHVVWGTGGEGVEGGLDIRDKCVDIERTRGVLIAAEASHPWGHSMLEALDTAARINVSNEPRVDDGEVCGVAVVLLLLRLRLM